MPIFNSLRAVRLPRLGRPIGAKFILMNSQPSCFQSSIPAVKACETEFPSLNRELTKAHLDNSFSQTN